jgi:uncharacterized protein YggE
MNGLTDIQKHRIIVGATILMSILSLYFVAKLVNEIKTGEYIGAQDQANTIQVTGEGEVFAVPDIALITFSARGEGADIKTAQTKEADSINKALAYVKSAGIAEKDIKTTSYNAQPKYEFIPCKTYPCQTREQKIVGYEVYQSVEIKVRNTDKSGDIVAGLGGVGITDIYGPNFSIDDEDALKADAREKAITDAREKAKVLAKQLGVRIVRISGFQESGGAYPMMYAKDAVGLQSAGAPAPSPEMPKGENKISSTVTITYEIR